MTVVEHYVVYDLTRPKRAHLALRDAEEAQQHRETGFTVEGPFVHKDQLAGAVKTLERIREHAGAVCATYETCEHPACQASYAAWTLADEYLQRGQSSDVKCSGCGTTRAQAVIDCPGCDVPRGHVHRSSEPNTEETR